MDDMPRLSEQLAGPKHPLECQSCGAAATSIWQEHDDIDRPTRVMVCLCQCCADRLIEAHPRLYRRLQEFEPFPGVILSLCVDCVHRDGVSCSHPDLIANGGKGLRITMPMPTRGFVDYGGKQKHMSGPFTSYRGWPSECAGREVEEPCRSQSE